MWVKKFNKNGRKLLTKNTTDGFPIKAIAVDNFLLLPPEYVPAHLLPWASKPNFRIPHTATYKISK